jgi:hypothetical protein
MDKEEFSIIIWCWSDPQTNATLLHVVDVETGKEVHLDDASFLLRISIHVQASVTRCYIRHIASGREAYVQGGPNLRTFVLDCLIKNDTS